MAPMRVERWDVRLDGTLSEEALQRKIESLGFEISAGGPGERKPRGCGPQSRVTWLGSVQVLLRYRASQRRPREALRAAPS